MRVERRRVRRLWKRWEYLLAGWHIDLVFHPGEFTMSDGEASADSLGTMTSDWRYIHCTAEWNLALVKRADDDELELAVVHEMCHALLNEMRTPLSDIDHEERTAEVLARALIRTRKSR